MEPSASQTKIPPLSYLENSTTTGSAFPHLDNLLLEIEEIMNATGPDSSNSPTNHHSSASFSSTSSVPILFPTASLKQPPPLPPRIPHGFLRKVSLPSLTSNEHHRPQLSNLPPVPPLPHSYSIEPHSSARASDHPPPFPSRFSPNAQSSARARADTIPEPVSNSLRQTLPSSTGSSSSSSPSPLSFFRRPLPNPRGNPSPPSSGQASSSHAQSSHHRNTSSPSAGSIRRSHTAQHLESSSSSQPLTPSNMRPLPHLPSSNHPSPHSTLSPSNSHETHSPANSLPSSSSPVHNSKRPPIFGASVSYTNMLHDHDSPLGAHSIPTRIGTRPINFTSPDHTDPLPELGPDGIPYFTQVAEDPPGLKPINVADREMFMNGPRLFGNDSELPCLPVHSPLQIYTTRPSIESSRPETSAAAARYRSNSASGFAEPSDAQESSGLSVDRPRRFLSQSKGASTGFRSEHVGGSRSAHLAMDPRFNLALMSHIGKFLKDNVPKGTKIKGSIEYPSAFTGREAVSTITHCLNRINPSTKSTTQATLNRKLALALSRKLLSEAFFHEVNNLSHEIVLNDNIDEVYVFPSDDHPLELAEALPQGVLTNLTSCYSFSCRAGSVESVGACYSYDCPKKQKRDSVLGYNTSITANNLVSDTPAPVTVVQTQDWASVVSKDLLATLDSKEIARQSIIYEIVSGEQEYVTDLDDYEKLFITPLKTANPPIIQPQRLESFLTKVVSNVLEIRDHNRVLLQNLLIRQQDQHPLVKGIGDIILNSALEWGADYIRYTNDHVFGEVEVNEEKRINVALADLLNQIPKQSARRADFKHYFLRASVRLQRYILLLDNLLRKTPGGHEDRANIEAAIDVIKRQCKDANLSVELQQARLRLVNLNSEIVMKADTPDLQLLSPNRQLFHSGKVVRRPDGGTALSESTELALMLFDHYFLITKSKRHDESTIRYHLYRPPILLELLRISGLSEPPERKTRGLRTITGTLGQGGTGLERGNSDPYSTMPIAAAGGGGGGGGGGGQEDRWLFPITIHALGKAAFALTFFVESERVRQVWKAKFEEAIGMRMQILDTFKVFDLQPMTDQTFAASSSGTLNNGAPIGVNGVSGGSQQGQGQGATPMTAASGSGSGENALNMHGPPTCSVPFKSADGKQLIAIGCSDGLWIGLRNDPSSVRQVIHIRGITQCAVLQEFGFLLVLAEKILLAYPLESLVPSRAAAAHSAQAALPVKKGGGGASAIASRLSGNKDVLFFRCGKVGPRTLVIYVKKGGVNQTVFKALEPVKNTDKVKATTSRGFFGIGGQKSESFRGYKEFFVPSESYAIQYLRSMLAIHCARGFEIMNLDTLKTASIPDFQSIRQHDPRIVALQRRCDESRPLGMFRLGENEFLLCYDEFAFFADKHGDPLPDRYSQIIEWDGKPAAVAYSAPYVIAFSPTIVEVWNTHSAKRVQLVVGQGMGCTYDGGSLGDEGMVHVTSGAGLDDEGERRIHMVLREPDGFFRVFEMVPLRI